VKLLGGKLNHSADATTNEACFWFSLPLQTVVSERANGQAPGSIGKRSSSNSKPKVTFASLSACDEGVGINVAKERLSRQTSAENSGCNTPKNAMRVLIVDDSAICQKVGVYRMLLNQSKAVLRYLLCQTQISLFFTIIRSFNP